MKVIRDISRIIWLQHGPVPEYEENSEERDNGDVNSGVGSDEYSNPFLGPSRPLDHVEVDKTAVVGVIKRMDDHLDEGEHETEWGEDDDKKLVGVVDLTGVEYGQEDQCHVQDDCSCEPSRREDACHSVDR